MIRCRKAKFEREISSSTKYSKTKIEKYGIKLNGDNNGC